MNETSIKTNLGIILETVLAKAIEKAGFKSTQDYQYDPTCEKPDFLIPNSIKPKYMIEVHQTEARNSFQMKTLRAFTAVTESKAYYGDNLVSVNVLFGDPEKELPASNVKALCGVYDVNLIPRKNASKKTEVIKMEKDALDFASNDAYKNKTTQAANEVVSKHGKAIATLGDMMKVALGKSVARKELFPMWKAERKRIKSLAKPPTAGIATYFKRGLLGSLFISDEDFRELFTKKDLNLCSSGVQQQLLAVKLADLEENIDGDDYILDKQFNTFISEIEAKDLRDLCKSDLDTIPDLHWFFEDIRDTNRRKNMVKEFLSILKLGKKSIINLLVAVLRGEVVRGIEHSRCWPADLLSLLSKHSQNDFNRRMVQSGRDPENYQYPFNHITGRFERLLSCPHHFEKYAAYAVDIFYEICSEDKIDDKYIDTADLWLPDELLKLRLDGAIKLQKFNPLNSCLVETCRKLDIDIKQEKIKSITYDLAGGKGRLGKYDLMILKNNNHSVIALSVAVHDHNGDHKSKEWGARRLASLYRYENSRVKLSKYKDGLFILDGEWDDKDITRLHRSGWNHICRLSNLENELKNIFKIKGKGGGKK